ncbi:hypothetical protein BGZ83_008126 [Gryganskiella cystojenkinii]|nr:hypothetical protein BGZ83_008126 [Gryganskiella cystojenkinii]
MSIKSTLLMLALATAASATCTRSAALNMPDDVRAFYTYECNGSSANWSVSPGNYACSDLGPWYSILVGSRCAVKLSLGGRVVREFNNGGLNVQYGDITEGFDFVDINCNSPAKC